MSNFQAWINNADMPVKKDGVWVDLETGIAYNSSANYGEAPKLSKKALEARGTAKFFGGKALTGSIKQKEWAEKIRLEVITKVSEDQAVALCNPLGIAKSAHFWIENRNKKPNEFGDFIELQCALLKQAKTLHSQNKNQEYRQVATKYNELTTLWGFTK